MARPDCFGFSRRSANRKAYIRDPPLPAPGPAARHIGLPFLADEAVVRILLPWIRQRIQPRSQIGQPVRVVRVVDQVCRLIGIACQVEELLRAVRVPVRVCPRDRRTGTASYRRASPSPTVRYARPRARCRRRPASLRRAPPAAAQPSGRPGPSGIGTLAMSQSVGNRSTSETLR